MKRKLVATMLAMGLVLTTLAGCSSANEANANSNSNAEVAAEGSVYYLNFKPEQDEQWQDIAKAYEEETGIPTTVVTAASGTYEATLKSEMAKDEAPTLFQVNGSVGLASCKDYCKDLSESEVYKHVKSDDFVLNDGDSVAGIAYVIETYGIIYNKTVLEAYCGMDGAKVASIDEINNFDKLKEVADDIQSRLDEVSAAAGADYDLQGAFTSAGMDSSSDWRFKTHLANLPIYYEYKEDGIGSTDAIKGSYLDEYKQIWDLYITDSTCEPTMIATKTGDEANADFALGNAVFYQNGTWAYSGIIDAGVLSDEDLGMMPIYIGADGEEDQGLCTGSENYWCINSKVSDEDQKATEDFLNWVITSDKGRDILANEMNFVTPFDTFDDGYVTSNPFVAEANKYIEDGKTAVAWTFTTMPSEEWKNGVGSALTAYASETGTWDDVTKAFVDGWVTEYNATH
ncbi:ABC transporter substrate-binding protein [Clostridium sp. DL1XJH146]